ncbi:MAG TPA: hypothetical protein VN682_01755 [Terriglobales bacterium]|nr:hypothetical protein [Terriglobales bacterium]HXF12459.1 hypothetical protein [Terriglobales bacterium]
MNKSVVSSNCVFGFLPRIQQRVVILREKAGRNNFTPLTLLVLVQKHEKREDKKTERDGDYPELDALDRFVYE